MIKIAIADDEQMMREGIREAFDWEKHGLECVGTCKNGQEAYALALHQEIDIFLLDICMPKISGLELIKKLNSINKDMLYIIISGYSEFEYAHQAIQLGVYDYVVKPIDEAKLLSIILGAKGRLLSGQKEKERINFLHMQMQNHLSELQHKFVHKLVTRGFDHTDTIRSECHQVELDFGENPGLLLIKHVKHLSPAMKWSEQLLYFAYKNLITELLESLGPTTIVSKDFEDQLFALTAIEDQHVWQAIDLSIEEAVFKYLGQKVRVVKHLVKTDLSNCHEQYKKLDTKVNADLSENIRYVIRRLESDYANNTMDLNQIADELAVSASHLSRLIKKELGISFKEYLIQLRMERAIALIKESDMRINEIAERVGYTNQHYFAHAFKKATGYSPSVYRQHHEST